MATYTATGAQHVGVPAEHCRQSTKIWLPTNARCLVTQTAKEVEEKHDQKNRAETNPRASTISPSPVAVVASTAAQKKNKHNQ